VEQVHLVPCQSNGVPERLTLRPRLQEPARLPSFT